MIKMINKLQPYKPHLYYKLYRALQDEGWSDSEMYFDKDITYVMPEGFFTFRFEHGEAVLVHYLVWPEVRGSFLNMTKLYRAFQCVLLSLNEVTFIGTVDPGREYFHAFFRWIERGRELTPYAIDENGTQYFRITFRR